MEALYNREREVYQEHCMVKKVFVSGCYDLLHSGHVEFFRQAAEYGDLYVGIGSDATILDYSSVRGRWQRQQRWQVVRKLIKQNNKLRMTIRIKWNHP